MLIFSFFFNSFFFFFTFVLIWLLASKGLYLFNLFSDHNLLYTLLFFICTVISVYLFTVLCLVIYVLITEQYFCQGMLLLLLFL